MPRLMTPDSPHWRDFMILLGDRLEAYGCDGDTLTQVRKVMKHYPEYDLEGTLDYLHSHSGHCDCEVFHDITVDIEF